MNIPFIGRRSGTAPQISDVDRAKAERINLAPKHGPRRGKLPTEGQQARALRRQRRRDSAATAKRSRRNAFLINQRNFHFGQNALGMARVYFNGAGTPEMHENVSGHINLLAERLSKAQGIPYSKAQGMVEDRLREVLEAHGELETEDVA